MSVVVGHIPTNEGTAALRHGAQEARLRGCSLVLVKPSGTGREPDPQAAARFDEALHQVRSDLESAGGRIVEEQAATGHEPADDLIDIADSVEAQCIVIGLRRRSPIGKLVLGSNAQRILLEAHCPVIAVKASD